MDLKSKNKVLNIILSILILSTILLTVGGLVCGLLISETQATMPGYLSKDTLIDIFKNVSDFFKYLSSANFNDQSTAASAMGQLFFFLFYLAAFIGCAIGILVNSIFLLIRTIQGFSKPVPSGRLTRHMLFIAAAIGVYCAVLLGLVYNTVPSYSYISGLGVGPIIQLVAAFMYVVIACVIHIVVRDDRKMVGKIFQSIITVFAFFTLVILLMNPFDFGEGVSSALPRLVCSLIVYIISGSSGDLTGTAYMAIFGFALVAVSFFTLAKLVCTPLGVDEPGKKVNDYGKSAIVKSALFLGFFVIGIVILFVTMQKLGTPDNKFAIPGILSLAMTGTLLALSIVSKCVDKGPVAEKQGPVDAIKEQIAAFVPQKEEEPKEVEPEPIEAEVMEEPAEEEAPAEPAKEPEPEPQPEPEREPLVEEGPKFCPNCGAPVKGKKFCSSCGTKLI